MVKSQFFSFVQLTKLDQVKKKKNEKTCRHHSVALQMTAR